MSASICLVVPCFNEAQRLRHHAWAALCERTGARLLFVDDGSNDATTLHVERIAALAPMGAVSCLRLPSHSGKSEAVRQGLLRALQQSYAWVGYVDADLATPVDELARLMQHAVVGGPAVIMGSRVRRLGARIERSALRYLAGRIFAHGAAWALALPLHDSQCGAKLFAVNEVVRAALERPFASPWVFDVELLARLLQPARGLEGLPVEGLLEVPLAAWRDVPGSKLTPWDFPLAAVSLLRTGWATRRRRTGEHISPRGATPVQMNLRPGQRSGTLSRL